MSAWLLCWPGCPATIPSPPCMCPVMGSLWLPKGCCFVATALTRIRRQSGICCLLGLGNELFGLGKHLGNAAEHVESGLGEVVVVTSTNSVEGVECVLEVNLDTW